MTLHRQAANLASKGRKGDSVLVHMTPKEVAGLNGLALSLYGKPLTINPKTGLVEANLLKQWIGPIVGAVAGGLGWSGTTAAMLGGIANGLANGMTLKNVGLGSLGAWGAHDTAKDLMAAQTGTAAPTPSTPPPPGTTPTAPAPASKTLDQSDITGDIHGAPAPVTQQATQAAQTAAAQVAATPKVTPTAIDKLKTLGTNAVRTLNDPKTSKAFMDSHRLQMLAAVAAAGATTQRAPKNAGEAPMQRWESQWEPGIVNPNYGKFAGEPYYLPGTRGFKNGRWTNTPYGTVAPTDQAAYTVDPEAYRFLHPIAAAKGGYLASGGPVPTEEPVKSVPPVVMQQPTSGGRYNATSDEINAYLDRFNASLHPVARAATGTGTTTTAPPTGGGSGTASGGGSTPGGAPAGVVPPPTTTVGEAPGSATGTSYMGGTNPFGIDGGYGTPIQTGLNTMPSDLGTQYTPANEVGVNHAPTGTSSGTSLGTTAGNAIKNTLNTVTDAINLPKYLAGQVANWFVGYGGKILNMPQSWTNRVQTAIDAGTGNFKNMAEFKQALQDWKDGKHTPQTNAAIELMKKLMTKEEQDQANAPETPADEVGVNHPAPVTVTQGGGGLGLGGGFNGSGGGTGSWGGIQLPPSSVTVEDVPGAYGAPGKAAGGRIGYAGGGGIASLGSYSDGGRYLRGPGDGVSDDIPAEIHHPDGEKQPARLATGEFVLPARFVSEMGNGDSNKGAERLYAVIDAVQKDRKRTTKNIAEDTNAMRHFEKYMA